MNSQSTALTVRKDDATMICMDKKKSERRPTIVVLHIEIPAEVKSTMQRLAKLHERKMTGECLTAFKDYIARHRGELDDADAHAG